MTQDHGPPLIRTIHSSLSSAEVTVSRNDWLKELNNLEKAQVRRQYCTNFYVVAPSGIVKPEELPYGWGLMIKPASENNLAALPMPAPVVSAITYPAIKPDRLRRG